MEKARNSLTESIGEEEEEGSEMHRYKVQIYPGILRYPDNLENQKFPGIILSLLDQTNIRVVWKLVKHNESDVITQTYINFFKNNEQYMDYFRKRNRDIKFKLLHSHSKAVFDIFQNIIDDGLQYQSHFNVMMTDLVCTHRKANVPFAGVELYTQSVKAIIQKLFEESKTDSLVKAVDRFLKFFTKSYLEEEERDILCTF